MKFWRNKLSQKRKTRLGHNKSRRKARKAVRARRELQDALTIKLQIDQQMRAKVAGCNVNELHNKKNRWVLNNAKFNLALQA